MNDDDIDFNIDDYDEISGYYNDDGDDEEKDEGIKFWILSRNATITEWLLYQKPIEWIKQALVYYVTQQYCWHNIFVVSIYLNGKEWIYSFTDYYIID